MAARFDQPDKLSDVKPWNSPYAFCGGDPINRTDPTGNDYELIIDDENKTMTVSAVYYACTPDMKSLNKAIAFWNGQSGIHQVGEYTIMFKLEAVEIKDYGFDDPISKKVDSVRKTAAEFAAKNHNETSASKNGNSYVVSSKVTDTKAGNTENYKIEINKRTAKSTTGSHEIGHTLGMMHDTSGLMTPSANDDYRSASLTENNIVDMVKNAFPAYSNPPKSSYLGKGNIKIINQTIERLYLFNYNNLKKRK